MDKYSRLLVQFSSLNGNNNEQEPYPNFIKDLALLESPSEELMSIIKEDLPTILPAILILSLHNDVSVRIAIEKTFDTFSNIMQKHPSVKNESWWRDMEDKLIAQQYSSRLSKMVENNDEPWTSNWVFVANLIVVNSEHVHSTGINSLLKVLELAFRMCKKNDQFMEKAYFCWNQLIDAFSRHPRVSASQKLVELFVRPLSTTHLSAKCPELKMQTWCNLMRKIGFSSSKQCMVIIEPFIDNMYYKDDDSLCKRFPLECLKALDEVAHQKKYYRYFAMKLLSVLPKCYQTVHNEEMEDIFLKIWKRIIERVTDVPKENKNEYIIEFFSVFYHISQIEKIELNKELNNVVVEKKIFNLENLRICMESKLGLVPIISRFMQYDSFRNNSFSEVVKELLENYTDSNNKQQQNGDLQMWDLLCESYTTYIKSYDNPQINDSDSLSSLLMAPIIWKQWSVVAVQRTWFTLVDAIQARSNCSTFLSVLFEKIKTAINSSLIPINVCIEICTHITDGNKLVFKEIMPILKAASSHVSPKEPKPLMDLMVLLENAINHAPKNELSKFVNELMANGNKYEHPWGIRIKTKCSKVLRKLLMLKDTSEEHEEKLPVSQENEHSSGAKVRSPIIAQSNFLHRLAKAEEKKKMKVPTHASIFGEQSPKRSAETKGKIEETTKTSPAVKLPVAAVTKEVICSGRLSPVIPSTVTIITPSTGPRSCSKSPDPTPASVTRSRSKSPDLTPSRKSLPTSLKTYSRRSPTYFDETAQEEFVVVPPKQKTTPLTEHQKEMLSKRKSYIPALYEDLTQDTQSESQSLKEIDVLKYAENMRNETVSSIEVKSQIGNKVQTLSKALENESKRANDENKIINPTVSSNDSSEAKLDEEKHSEKSETSTNESICHSADMFNSESLKLNSEIEKNSDKGSFSETPTSVKKDESLPNVDCISTEQAATFNVTPTKQPGPPTPRNLIMKINLIEEIEEEEEREKENKFINAKQNDALVKRRSARKSISKFSSKNTDESKDEKPKKTAFEIPKVKIEPPENIQMAIDDNCVTNVKNASTIKDDSQALNCEGEDTVLKADKIPVVQEKINNHTESNTSRNILKNIVHLNVDDSQNEVNVASDKDADDSEAVNTSDVSVESNSVEGKEALNDTEKIENNENETNMGHQNDSVKINPNAIILSEENSESPSGVVNSWAMTTASAKTKPRKKKSSVNSPQFSPKLLRSKRLSLSKNNAEKTDKPPTKKTRESKYDGGNATKPEEVKEATKNSPEFEKSVKNCLDEGDNSAEKKNDYFEIEVTPNRKRRNENEDNDIDEKRKKNDEPISQDSLLMVKNNFTGKPRKKKVIKSNVKSSPNNLEQWLIRAGRTVVVKDVLSQEDGNSEAETSKIIEDSPDIQINVSESKNIVVEKVEHFNSTNELSSISPEKTEDVLFHSEPDVSPEKSHEEEENPHNITVVVTSPASEDDLEQVKCQEDDVPSTPEMDAEKLRRKHWRVFKKEDTPVRELPTRPQRRAAYMVKMATSEEDPYIRTPIKKRASIKPFKKTENWPEGRSEPWVPCIPTPPSVSPSLSILKKRQATSSPPPSTPPSSPQVKKKRVSFLDPVVISGLMYAKNCWQPTGEVQYADIPPGERPIWVADNDEARPGPSNEPDNVDQPSEEKPEVVESVEAVEDFKDPQECELVQNFLNSTPDAPWNQKIPPELDLTGIDELNSCTESPAELLAMMYTNPEERTLAEEELKKYGVVTVADFRSISLTDLAKFCDGFLKAKSLSGIIEEYLKGRKACSKKADAPEKPEESKTDVVAMEIDKDDMLPKPTPTSLFDEDITSNEERHESEDEDPKELDEGTTASSRPVQADQDAQSALNDESGSSGVDNSPHKIINKKLKVSDVVDHIPHLLEDPEFRNTLASRVLDLPEKELESFVRLILKGLPKKTGTDSSLSLVIDLLQTTKNELRHSPD